ncbi:transposase family protein [Saccharopolyspora shandongensis]|uniref:transposase family protein n=1 Tax=Saccharopolyspora shandongensis TaxID=418495 RepID=UPI003F4D0F4E
MACPGCGTLSDRVHSRYQRRLSDTSISSREVLIRLQVRRLFCDNTECVKKTFAEAVPELAARYGRRTTALERVLCAVALALGGRAGARLTQLNLLVTRPSWCGDRLPGPRRFLRRGRPRRRTGRAAGSRQVAHLEQPCWCGGAHCCSQPGMHACSPGR